jgi:heat shock protein 90kDa beta
MRLTLVALVAVALALGGAPSLTGTVSSTALAGFARAEETAPETPDVGSDGGDVADAGDSEEDRAKILSGDGFTADEEAQVAEGAEKHSFEAEIGHLMDIIVNSLYTHPEVFLRELISNGSDALEKTRFRSLTNPDELRAREALDIRIRVDPVNNVIEITDSGVGMTKAELIQNLGTVARSGTGNFLKVYEEQQDSSLIGQFGVGFYSIYLVADTVTVTSKSNDADKQYIWRSKGAGDFTVSEDPRGDTLGRGTRITIHLNDESHDFADVDRVKELVGKYSEFIAFPIYLYVSKEVEVEVEMTPEEIAAQESAENDTEDEDDDDDDDDVISLDEGDEEKHTKTAKTAKTTKTEKKRVWEWELANEVKPIWTRSPKEVTEEEYLEFYRSFAQDTHDPLFKIHFLAEGEIEFKSLLYIPAKPEATLFHPEGESDKNIKLYVKRVFITDEFKDLLPKYLHFLKGVVDSDDLPLNVGREMLQKNRNLVQIRKKLIRKAIAMFQMMAEAAGEDEREKYNEFWEMYGTNIKLGIVEDPHNRQRLSKLLMFRSSKVKTTSSDEIGSESKSLKQHGGLGFATLGEYVGRMKKAQSDIYFIAGDSVEKLQTSPLLGRLEKEGFEVLFLTEPIDEYTLESMEKFDGKYKFKNVAKEDLKLSKDDERHEKLYKRSMRTVAAFLKHKLSQHISQVKPSSRLTDFPAVLVSTTKGWTANMERLYKAQALGDPTKSGYEVPKKVLEINPRHPMMQELKRRVEAALGHTSEEIAGDKDLEKSIDYAAVSDADPVAGEIAELLFDTATLSGGWDFDDPQRFAKSIVKVMNEKLGLERDAEVPEPEPEPEAEPEDEEGDGEEEGEEEVEVEVEESADASDAQ